MSKRARVLAWLGVLLSITLLCYAYFSWHSSSATQAGSSSQPPSAPPTEENTGATLLGRRDELEAASSARDQSSKHVGRGERSNHSRVGDVGRDDLLHRHTSVDCASRPQADLPFCNSSLSPEERASDLIKRLSLDEAIQQTSSIAPGISRLGINAYNWRSNCLHGWSKSGGRWTSDLVWTVFPAPIGLGATFDVELVRAIGQVTADEGRALHNEMLAKFNGDSTEAAGLNCFSPNVNLFRDPRWGRGMETFGEDPYLISVIGTAYTRGLQEGEHPDYLKVAACAKHFAVHSGPEKTRLKFSAKVTLRDLYDTYLPAFKSQVLAAKVAQVMPAYSGVQCRGQPDGVLDAANHFLLKTVLKKQFGAAKTSVCSDNGALKFLSQTPFASSPEEAASLCINAGTDLDLGHDMVYPKYLPDAVRHSLVNESAIRDAVWRSFYLRMLVGDFDPPSMVPYQNIDASHLNTKTNWELNLRAARESIVLLKNRKGFLPLLLDGGASSIAVIGPNAVAEGTLLSNYQGIPPSITTVLGGIRDSAKGSGVQVSYVPGCSSVKCPNDNHFKEALELASKSDVVVMVMGLDSSVEDESRDRQRTLCNRETRRDILALPGCQELLVTKVADINKNIVLVLINGGPVSMGSLYSHEAVVAVLEAFYPGPLGGQALADVLFGRYNPSGRMPVTVYRSIADVPPFEDYDMTTPPGRTYRYFTGKPLVPFGFGLSYTEFEYVRVELSRDVVQPCESLTVTVLVRNAGEAAGEEAVLVFIHTPEIAGKTFPRKQLLAFDRVTLLQPGQEGEVQLTLSPYQLALVDDDGRHYVFPGDYKAEVGLGRYLKEFSVSGLTTASEDCTTTPQCFACPFA